MKKRLAAAAATVSLAVAAVVHLTRETEPTCTEPPIAGDAPGGLYDLAVIRNRKTLGFRVLSTDRVQYENGERVLLRRVAFDSFEWKNCRLEPYRIEAYLGTPASTEGTRSGRLGGVVRAHGLEPMAERESAIALAAEGQLAVLSFFNAGADPDFVFDTVPSPRRSFFFRHTVAMMRGLTVLETLPEVDASKLAVTGISGGGITSFVVGAVDDRVKVVSPWFASGFADVAIRSTPVPSWHDDLLGMMSPPRNASSPEWLAHLAWFDAKNAIRTGFPDSLYINGSRDQFFPIHTTTRTFGALEASGGQHRLWVVANFDHSERGFAMIEEVRRHLYATTAWWIRRRLFLPDRPALDGPRVASATVTKDRVAVTASAPTAVRVQLHVSADRAKTFRSVPLVAKDEVWSGEIAVSGEALYFVEATYVVGKREIRLTSVPVLPAGFVPAIDPM